MSVKYVSGNEAFQVGLLLTMVSIIIGLFLSGGYQPHWVVVIERAGFIGGWLCNLVATVLKAWEKGYSPMVGVIGLFHIAGYAIVWVLPDQSDNLRGFDVIQKPSETKKL